MTRIILSLTMFAVLSIGVGFLLAGDDETFDWRVGGGLFAIALAGEAIRYRIRRSRARSGQSSGI
ncbi:hypothetical protein FB561_1330 [Kribbella amoyensis]|uniref:Uncharacterized protein n=1 Tax=Kribbella amoyensis TaxID=996641 RepID=A0A561BN39_9ACTN|nr:hypothetical protein [Kribbella amoyensis]TWD80257.1 hypothetical protein FB561_1330 [Kribbella amoyensis]